MSLDLAIAELHQRRAEQAEAERIGTWEAHCAMKSRWGYRRRKVLGWPRSKLKSWLEAAEKADGGVTA